MGLFRTMAFGLRHLFDRDNDDDQGREDDLAGIPSDAENDIIMTSAAAPASPPMQDEFTVGVEEVAVTFALMALSFVVLSTPLTRRAKRSAMMGWLRSSSRHLRRYCRRGSADTDDPAHGRWEDLLRSGSLGHDKDKTVRARGGHAGTPTRSAPSTPLKSLFHSAVHLGTVGSLEPPPCIGKEDSDTDHYTDHYTSHYTNHNSDHNSICYRRPETDHDRFERAWKSHIRHANYNRLVLPPECKLVDSSHRKADSRSADETSSTSWIRPTIAYWHSLATLIGRIMSVEGTQDFLLWIMSVFRYRMRKARGLPVEEDDDDDGSEASCGSAGNRTFPVANGSHKINGGTTFKEHKWKIPSDYLVPQLVDSNESKHAQDNTKELHRHVDKDTIGKLSLRPRKRILTADEGDDATFVSASGLEQSESVDGGSTTSFEPSSKPLHHDCDIPSSVESKNALTISPIPTRHFKPKKKDALEHYRNRSLSSSINSSFVLPAPDPPPPKQTTSSSSPTATPKQKTTHVDDASTMNFFDTVNSRRQLRDISRAVPLPDANGYILGDEFLNSSCTPLLVFVNSRSGPQQGHLLITQLRRILNPIQVWDLATGGPEKVLKSFAVLSRFRILVCGGDGTVSWIISALEKMALQRWPPIGILPLGTGNDLARVHGWGGGYNNESLLYILRLISDAYVSLLDLWELDIADKRNNRIKKAFTNYLGVGVDAQAALQVHMLRESKPKLFFSRVVNKAWYAIAGSEEAIKSSCANLPQQITLVADGVEIPLPPDSQGIIFLNIDSYSGGVPLWSKGLRPRKRVRRRSEGDFTRLNGLKPFHRNDSTEDLIDYDPMRELSFEEQVSKLTACDKPSSCQDGMLDVVSIRGTFHLGQIRVGLSNAQLLCQCRKAVVTLRKKMAVQIDGEPWRQNPSTLSIVRKPDRAAMLSRSADDSGGVESEVANLLDWASERSIIDMNQYALLMEEFSRRIEHKKRRQKAKPNGFSFVG